MARWLKQSTAFTFRIGPFLDSVDGVTAETGLSIAQADLQISKNGGAFAQTSASPTTTHDADGWYQCPLTATDTDTLGPLTVQVVMAGALPVWEHFVVVPAEVYDTFVAGTGRMARAVNSIVTGTADNGGSTTSVVCSAVSPSAGATDCWKGRIIVFANDTTTAALRGQASDITANTSGGTPTLTVTALTTAPASGDSFTIQ
jgi:hypothetical protein